MAITLVGSVTTSFANNGGNVTVNLSGLGLQQNDVVIASVASPRTLTDGTPGIVTSGYTQVITPFKGSITGLPSSGCWYKVMGATPDGSVEMSGDTASTTDTTGVVVALRGVNTSTVLDQTSVVGSETDTATPDPPAIVTQTNGAWVIVFCIRETIDTPTGTPSGYSNATDQVGNDTYDHDHAVATKEVASAGTEDPGSWTYPSSQDGRTYTIAIRPVLATTTSTSTTSTSTSTSTTTTSTSSSTSTTTTSTSSSTTTTSTSSSTTTTSTSSSTSTTTTSTSSSTSTTTTSTSSSTTTTSTSSSTSTTTTSTSSSTSTTSTSSSTSTTTTSTSSSTTTTSTSTSSSTSTTSTSTSTSITTTSTSTTTTSTSTSTTTTSTSSSTSTSTTSTSSSTSTTSTSTSTSITTTSTSSSTSTTSTSTSSSTTSTSTSTTTTFAFEGEMIYGEENPSLGEIPISWATWDGTGTITGDPDWGKLALDGGENQYSQVYDFGNTDTRTYSLIENRYGVGSGSATLQIRGSTTVFAATDGTPTWNDYTDPTAQNWRYVQVRVTK